MRQLLQLVGMRGGLISVAVSRAGTGEDKGERKRIIAGRREKSTA